MNFFNSSKLKSQFEISFYRPFKRPICSSNVDVNNLDSQPFFIRFIFKKVFIIFEKFEGKSSPEAGAVKPKTDSDSEVGKKLSDLSQYYHPYLTKERKDHYKIKIKEAVKTVEKSDQLAEVGGDNEEYSILNSTTYKLFNLLNIDKGEFFKGFSKVKEIFVNNDPKKTQKEIDTIINAKGQKEKNLHAKFPGGAHGNLISDSLDFSISRFEHKIRILGKDGKDISFFVRFLKILKSNKNEIANIIHEKISNAFIYGKYSNLVFLSGLITLIINEIQVSILLKEGLTWASFKGPKSSHRVDNLFIKSFLSKFFGQCKGSFIVSRIPGKIEIKVQNEKNKKIKTTKKVFIYNSMYTVSWSGTKESFEQIINKFRYIELKNMPRVIPFQNWEADPSGSGTRLVVMRNKKEEIVKIPGQSFRRKLQFKARPRFLNIINTYQNQAILVSKSVLYTLLNNGHFFSGSYFSDESKPIFGTALSIIDYVLLFVKYCFHNNIFLSHERLLLFCVSFKEFSSNFLRRKKEALWLSFYIENNLPLYFRYGFDFRGRDALSSLLNPIKNRFSRACLTFNHSSEVTLSTRGMLHYTIFVFNLFSIENSPGKFKCYSSIILYVFKGVTPELPALIIFVKTTVQQAPFIIITQKKCLYYIPTFCNVGLIPFIEIYLDASASAFQILIALCNSFEKASILNLVNHASGECQDAYSIWAIPTEKELLDTPCLKDLTREIKKKFFTVSLYGADIGEILNIFKEDFGLDSEVAGNFWTFLNNFYQSYFKKELKIISYLYEKFKNSDGGVSINLPLYDFNYTYYKNDTTQQLDLDELKVVNKNPPFNKCRPSYSYVSYKKLDSYKRSTAFSANLIQALDAHAKHFVVEEFRSKGYHVFTIHDCFKVHPNHGDFAIAAYNRAIVNISEIFIEDLKDCKDFTCFTEDQKQKILDANYSINAF